ncbi:MAG: Demethylspheroidene O-methyltransferase [Pseudomonadota bacterium]
MGQRSWQQVERRLSDPSLYPKLRGNWLTRWVTRRRTARLYELMSGFANTQVLVACVRMGLLDALARSERTATELSALLSTPESRLMPLLNASESMGLIRRNRQDQYGLASLAWPIVSHAGLKVMIEHNQLLYEDLLAPERFLREGGGRMQAFWPYVEGLSGDASPTAKSDDVQSQRYSEVMDASQVFVIEEVLASHHFAKHRCVMDVGCGMGRFMIRVGEACPQLKLKLFDLPPVVKLAAGKLNEAGLAGRYECHPGSFKTDELPRGADLITLVRIGHDHSDTVCLDLFRKAWAALPEGGQLLLAEPMAATELNRNLASAYFHFYLLAMGDGRLRSPQDYERMLREAGFASVKLLKTGLPIHAQAILATKLGFTPVFNSSSKDRLTHVNVNSK